MGLNGRLRKEVNMLRKIIQRIFFSVILLFLGYVVGTISSNCSSATKETEYKVIGVNHYSKLDKFEAELNSMGTQGWELVQFDKYIAIFKR